MTSSAPRTPIRAITNPSLSISSRAPSLPAYAPYLTHALSQKQLKYILPRTVVLAWAVASGTAIWQGGDGWIGTLLIPINVKVILATGLLWIAGVLPVLVARKGGVGEPRPRGTSPLSLLSSAWKMHKPKTTFLIHALSALALLAVHIFLAYSFEPKDPKLSLFVKSKKHPYYLSPRTLYLLLSVLPLITLQTLRAILLRAPFPSTPPSILTVPLTALALSVVSIPLTFALFLLLHFIFFPILSFTPILNTLLKPVIGHLLRPRTSFLVLPFTNVSLLFRSAILGFIAAFTWLTTAYIVDSALSQRILTSAPLAALIEGTDAKASKEGNIFQMYLAYQELLYRLQTFPGVAEEIFTDQKFQPTLWATLLRNSLLFLGERYQETLRRGAPPPPPPAVQKVEMKKREVEVGSPAQVLRKRVFKSGRPSEVERVLNVLASDGPIVDAVNHVPELFRSVSSSPAPAAASASPPPAAPSAPAVERPGLIAALVKRAKERAVERVPGEVRAYAGDLKKWAEMERVGRSVEVGVRGWEGVRGVVDVISFLTSASLHRDAFGTVQRDIPKILEAFTRFLAEIEGWTLELARIAEEEERNGRDGESERERGVEVLGEIGDSLKEGTALIVRTFGDKLLAFKFPTGVAGRVQGFLDYCAI
ncbi:nucleoporin protein Ndc1-Nup [Cyathus striatus]|nr:nucleoporin protein Ndc1-Nup [Cyathus striatus]